MYVYEKMSKNIVTANPEWSVSKAYQLMNETKHSRLPVVDESNRVVGFITEKILQEVNPSNATSLSMYEINYLLSKTKVRDIMRTGVFKISKNATVEEAALIIKENKVGSLVVVDEEQVVGIVTRSDVFRAFIDLLNLKTVGTRLELKLDDSIKDISEIVAVVSNNNMEILSMSNLKSVLAIKVAGTDTEKLVQDLKNKNFEVMSVIKQH